MWLDCEFMFFFIYINIEKKKRVCLVCKAIGSNLSKTEVMLRNSNRSANCELHAIVRSRGRAEGYLWTADISYLTSPPFGKKNHVSCSWQVKVKVKVTLVQALRLCTGRKAHRGSRCIALPFHDLRTRRGWGVSVTTRPLLTPQERPSNHLQEAGWAWTGAENLAPTGIRSPGRPACNQSLYWLRYLAQYWENFYESR